MSFIVDPRPHHLPADDAFDRLVATLWVLSEIALRLPDVCLGGAGALLPEGGDITGICWSGRYGSCDRRKVLIGAARHRAESGLTRADRATNLTAGE